MNIAEAEPPVPEDAGAHLRALFHTAPVGIITCDPSGRLTYANAAAERIWGQSLQRVGPEGWNRYRQLAPDGTPIPAHRYGLARALAGEAQIIRNEMIIERPDGSRVWVQASSSPVADSSGTLIGAIAVFTDITERKQAEDERIVLLSEARARAEREALINSIGQAQRATDDPEVVQATAVEALGRALGADRCYFTAFDRARDRAHIGSDWRRNDLPSLQEESRLPDFGLDFQAIFSGGMPLVISDVLAARTLTAPESILTDVAALGVRSAITIPFLNDDGALVATLTVAMAETPRAWSAEEVDLTAAVAAQTRATLETALLLRRQSNIADRLQRAIQPIMPEAIPGMDVRKFFEPALEEATVGGDFFDVFPLGPTYDRRTVLVVGDLSGKGLAAAAQIATVRNMLRYALYQGDAIDDAVSRVNRTLAENGLIEGFATVFVSIFEAHADGSGGTLTYVSCGHEPALLRRHGSDGGGGAVIEDLAATGPALGAMPEGEFTSNSVRLVPGDTLVVYTDGISEVRRNKLEFLGADGLANLLSALPRGLPASEVVTELVEGARSWSPHRRFSDDACILVAVIAGA